MSAELATDPLDLGRRAETMLRELGGISERPDKLLRRFLTPEHRRAADLVAGWMRESGLAVDEDTFGTMRGRFGEGRRVLIGSHIDTVVDAGIYDGPMGVVVGILAAEQIARRGVALPFGLDVLAFGDEEGSRFPVTMTSSAVCAGVFAESALAAADPDGITLEEALRRYGKEATGSVASAYRPEDVLGYVEVHIEQGPVLEARNLPLGVVTGIVGQSRMRVIVEGTAGHAGTVPMPLRHDALAGAAEMIAMVENLARTDDAGLVATVGRIEALPGAVNIIPARVEFTIDLRASSDRRRTDTLARFQSQAQATARSRGLRVAFEVFYEHAATPCDEAWQARLASAVRSITDTEARRLSSGAGHDAQVMARLCPAAMLFVRCRGGISHNPLEYAAPRDIGLAVLTLTRFIERLAADGAG